MSGKPKILIVDDEPRMCDSLEKLLSGNDYEIHTSYDGREATELLSRINFDIVLLDIVMPGMDGFQVMEYIEDQGLNTAVILMTGNASIESAVEALKKGAYDYLKKPFEHEELLITIKNTLDRKGLESNLNLAKKDLKESEEKYQRLFNTVSDAIMVFDGVSRKFVDVNDAATNLYGYTREEFLNLNHADITMEEKESVESIEQTLNGKLTRIPLRYHRKRDGTVFPAEISSSAFSLAGRKILCGVVREITERKQAEEAMRESEERLSTVLENLPGGVFAHDLDGRLLFVNETACKNTGYSQEELLNMSVADIDPSSVTRNDRSRLWHSLSLGESITVESTHIRKDGSQYPAEIHLNAVTMDGKRIILPIAFDFTDRKRAEEKLQESEERQKQILENSNAGYFFIDREGCFQKVNPAWLRLHKYETVEEIIGRHFSLTQVEADLPDAHDTVEHLLGGKEIMTGEFSRRCKDGSIGYHTYSARPVMNEGVIIGLEGFLIDITEHKQADGALRESEKRFRNLIEGSIQGILIHKDFRPLFLNKAYADIHGYTVDEILGMETFPTLFAPNERTRIAEYKEARMHNKEAPVQFEYQGQQKDGSLFWIDNVVRVVEWEGQPAIQTTIIDISERKLAEEELRKSEEHYYILLDAADRAGQAIILHQDIEGKEAACVFTNKTVSNITGYSREELSNLSWMDLLHPKHRDITLQRYRKRMAGEILQGIFEISIIAKDGSEVPIEISSTVTEYQGDIALISFFRDITDRKRMEEILLKTNKLESLGTLAGGIAHDFNNLLSIIMVNLSLAEGDIKSKTGSLKFLKAAEEASNRAKDLTARLITFSKGGEPVKSVVSIKDLIKDSVGAALSGSDIGCKFSIPDDLSSVSIDQGQMKQAIYNVVINAHEAMAGKGTIKVDCENVTIGENDALTLNSGKYVKISITDQGAGIPEENLAKIFDPYFSTKEMGEVKGMGLGLSSCHSIVENHNGLIIVESEMGVGTTLSIYLPASDKEIVEPEPARQPITEKPVTGKGKVLLMDDEQMIRDYAVPVLSQLGYDAEVSKDGAEAIDLYKKSMGSKEPFDVVILDLTCQSGMGGKEAIEKLLEIDPNVKAIVSTGYSGDPVMTNFLEYGFCGALTKPYSIGELSRVIKDVFFQE